MQDAKIKLSRTENGGTLRVTHPDTNESVMVACEPNEAAALEDIFDAE